MIWERSLKIDEEIRNRLAKCTWIFESARIAQVPIIPLLNKICVQINKQTNDCKMNHLKCLEFPRKKKIDVNVTLPSSPTDDEINPLLIISNQVITFNATFESNLIEMLITAALMKCHRIYGARWIENHRLDFIEFQWYCVYICINNEIASSESRDSWYSSFYLSFYYLFVAVAVSTIITIIFISAAFPSIFNSTNTQKSSLQINSRETIDQIICAKGGNEHKNIVQYFCRYN